MKLSVRPLCLLITVFSIVTLTTFALLTGASVPTVEAQSSCDNQPQGGGQSISADFSYRDTGQPLSGSGVAAAGTFININAFATAFGQCIGKGWNCVVSPCVCQESGFIYERTVNHIGVYVDVSTSGSLNGTYFVGNVYG